MTRAAFTRILLAGALGAPFAAGCRRHPSGHTTRAFYYWRTTFALSARESETLRRHHVQRMYLRLFDVAIDAQTGGPAPVGRCAFQGPLPAGVEIVPVVFITNAVFEAAPDVGALATRVWSLARAMMMAAGGGLGELQLDCDWTPGTREAFFDFCRHLGAAARGTGAPISATIRLHQIKYAERTGVPPVERGMLMFYNMGTLTPGSSRSSIFDAQAAGRYLATLDRYPLPLDAALAVFSWAVHGRGQRVVGLLEKVDAATLEGIPALDRRAAGQYVATRASFLRGRYLQAGDTLTLEAMTPPVARAAASLLATHFHPRHDRAIALFDLDERNLRPYGFADLEAIYASLG